MSDDGDPGENFTLAQYDCFRKAVEAMEARGLHFAVRHCANSGAVLDYPELQLDMVRPGIILYGMEPSESIRHPLDLQPAMELKNRHFPEEKKSPPGLR